jgi:hypothetical protein
MEKPRLTALDILRQLPKTNCRECGANTCMAFASQVIQKQKKPAACPYLDKSIIADLASRLADDLPPGLRPEESLVKIKKQVRSLDFAEAAARLGLDLVGDRLRVHVLGKVVDVDQNGDLHTLIHSNHWLQGPLLHYIANSRGRGLVGQWMPYTEMDDVEETAPFFEYFCEKAFLRLADEHTDLVISILEVFGKPVGNGLVDADVSIQLMPLPNVPFLYSYWRAEGDFPSRLSIQFDRSVKANLDPQSVLFLAAGIADMFSRFVSTHSG